jgi:hypothetical protein
MHLEKPSLAKHIQDPQNRGYAVLQDLLRARDNEPGRRRGGGSTRQP